MDQDAFRQLVSSSSSGPSSGKRTFGKAHKRHPAPSTSSSATTKPSDLKPRKLQTKPSDATPYVDRASARRSGTLASEFSDVEALHRDFEERIAAAETEEEKQQLRDQISSVGGDAKYSVLVKGLDWALLAQNKAKIEKESSGVGEDEGDLESAFEEGRRESKRSRDDVVEAIRRRREAKSAGASAGTGEKESAGSGFRPIGFKPIGGDKTEEDRGEYKWVNGKRMRRKKKASASSRVEQSPRQQKSQASDEVKGNSKTAESIGAADAQVEPIQSQPSKAGNVVPAKTARQGLASGSPSEQVVQPDTGQEATAPLQAGKASPKPVPEDDDDDGDIFADVGGWDGIPDKDQEVAEDAIPTPPAPFTDHTPTPPPAEPISPPQPASKADSPTPPPAPETATAATQSNSETLNPLPAPTSTSTTGAVPPSTPKPKKSKWDDDNDDDSGKKKKKKKHH